MQWIARCLGPRVWAPRRGIKPSQSQMQISSCWKRWFHFQFNELFENVKNQIDMWKYISPFSHPCSKCLSVGNRTNWANIWPRKFVVEFSFDNLSLTFSPFLRWNIADSLIFWFAEVTWASQSSDVNYDHGMELSWSIQGIYHVFMSGTRSALLRRPSITIVVLKQKKVWKRCLRKPCETLDFNMHLTLKFILTCKPLFCSRKLSLLFSLYHNQKVQVTLFTGQSWRG